MAQEKKRAQLLFSHHVKTSAFVGRSRKGAVRASWTALTGKQAPGHAAGACYTARSRWARAQTCTLQLCLHPGRRCALPSPLGAYPKPCAESTGWPVCFWLLSSHPPFVPLPLFIVRSTYWLRRSCTCSRGPEGSSPALHSMVPLTTPWLALSPYPAFIFYYQLQPPTRAGGSICLAHYCIPAPSRAWQ